MRSSLTRGTFMAGRSTSYGCLLSLSLLVLSGTAWAGDTMFIEFPGFERAELISAKLGDGKQVQTGIGGTCEIAKETVTVDREFGPPLSTAIAEAAAFGTRFDYLIVYRNNAQFWLHDAIITSYSVSGTVGGSTIESFVLEIADITVQPQ